LLLALTSSTVSKPISSPSTKELQEKTVHLKHGGEVKHGDVRLSVVVDGEVELRKLVVGGEVCRLSRVLEKFLRPNVFGRKQLGSVRFILKSMLKKFFLSSLAFVLGKPFQQEILTEVEGSVLLTSKY
jgi:hypothetical protein